MDASSIHSSIAGNQDFICAAIAQVASLELTEADEPLVSIPDPRLRQRLAITNVVYQVKARESAGVIDMYRDAALRAGVSSIRLDRHLRFTKRACS